MTTLIMAKLCPVCDWPLTLVAKTKTSLTYQCGRALSPIWYYDHRNAYENEKRMLNGIPVNKGEKMNWIKTSDMLPPERKYVLARYGGNNWTDFDDQKNVNCVVVKLVPRDDEDEDEDEEPNNLTAYNWETFGPSSFFGQDITHWCPIP